MRNLLFNKRNQVKTNNNPTSSRLGSFLNGFTIIELIVTISIIGILAAIGTVSYIGWQKSTITAQLKSDLSGVATAMENARTFGNAYPISLPPTFSSTPDTTLTYASGNDTSFCIDAISVKDSTLHFYIDNTTGSAGAQPGTCASRGINYTLTIAAGANGTVNSGGTYASGSTPNIAATPATYYSFTSWAGDTGCSGTASHSITMDANKTCTASFTATPISAPSAPTVTANTVGATTTWSWGAASCPGNTARYQYRYTYAPAGYDSGLIATASTSVGFTTSTEGQTYTVAVQAQCYNTATTSAWSTAGSAGYYRVITNYTLTINAGANGTVNSGGTYAAGSTPTITATPSAYYSFSSWTGDTGCSGIASHTITMDANKSCTANFTATPISAPSAPTVTANTVGATTTWSWGAASCPGNTARYQYRYTYAPAGYDSGWVATASTSVGFTTSTTGQTYTVQVQAQCYNTATTSAWSTAGSDSYARAGGWSQISAGYYHTCAIAASNNQAYCWGDNQYGQLGINSATAKSLVPVAVYTGGVLSGKTILSIKTGANHTCVIASDNLAYCWGFNGMGQLGNNSTTQSTFPVAVDTSGVLSGKTIKYISASDRHSCVVASNNLAYCWGNNSFGQLGNNSTTQSLVPVAVATTGVLSGKTIKSIEVGKYTTCVIASDNLVYCVGYNGDGELGNNSTTSTQLYVAVYTSGVLSGKTINTLSIKNYHTCVIASDNLAYCWGMNSDGALGNNTVTTPQTIPIAVYTSGVLSGKTMKIIQAYSHSCAVASDDKAYCWGANSYGMLGDNSVTQRNAPVAVYTSGLLSGKTIKTIVTGFYSSCVIASDDQAYCWGNDASYGQLGDNSTVDSHIPVAVQSAP